MRNFVQVIGNTLVFIMIFAISLLDASAQFKQRDILKIKGKVLSERKADITVFKKESNNWVMIRSMKSRKKYDIKLSPIEHYYIVFVSNDGIKKALFVEGGNVVNVVMKLDVDFKKKIIQANADHEMAHLELDLQVHSGEVDEGKIRAAGTKIVASKTNKIMAMIEAKIQLLNLLTAEQRQKMAKMH